MTLCLIIVCRISFLWYANYTQLEISNLVKTRVKFFMAVDVLLDLTIAYYSVFVAIIFGIICIKQRNLISWLVPAFTYAIGSIFVYLGSIDAIYGLIGALLYLVAICTLIIITFYEYYQMVYTKTESTNKISSLNMILMYYFLLNLDLN